MTSVSGGPVSDPGDRWPGRPAGITVLIEGTGPCQSQPQLNRLHGRAHRPNTVPAQTQLMNRAWIHVRRSRGRWADRFRIYVVMIDDGRVGEVGPGEEKAFDVAPGRHHLQLRIDWASSPPIECDLAPGEKLQLVCHGRNPLAAPYWATLGRNRYIMVEVSH